MATTHIISLHASAEKSIRRSISGILDYDKNPEKAAEGRLVSTYECGFECCNDESLVKKQIYEQITGRAEKLAEKQKWEGQVNLENTRGQPSRTLPNEGL